MSIQWARFLDPGALLLVGLGCLLVALVQNGIRGIMIGFATSLSLHRTADAGEQARLSSVIVEDIVRRRGVSCADRPALACAYTAKLASEMSDAPDFAAFAHIVTQDSATRNAARAVAVQMWEDIADAAPALGMLGTVIGLVEMFGRMESVEGLGTAMALCLLTSLYGLAFAHLIAGPIARRLQMLGGREAAWQTEISDRMLALARAEYPDRAPRRPVVPILGDPPDTLQPKEAATP